MTPYGVTRPHGKFQPMNFRSQTYTEPGGWFNIKTPSDQYRKFYGGDKTILRPSFLHNGISYAGKMTSLYWIRALNLIITLPASLHQLRERWLQMRIIISVFWRWFQTYFIDQTSKWTPRSRQIPGTWRINSLWHGDSIGRYRLGSTLAQVLACCLTALIHYLNQCLLSINGVLWYLPILQEVLKVSIRKISLKNIYLIFLGSMS